MCIQATTHHQTTLERILRRATDNWLLCFKKRKLEGCRKRRTLPGKGSLRYRDLLRLVAMENYYDDEEFLNTTPSPIKRPQYCDLSVVWKGRRDEQAYTYKPMKSEFSVKKPPFGLDKEITELPDDEVATGYRRGGPKEARLFRVALLAAKKEVDGLHPVRVSNIPEDLTEEQLAEEFKKYGAIGDIYIPRDLKRMTARNFAILRFEKEEAAKKALESRTATLKEIKAKRKAKQVEIDQLSKQWSVFTSNSGVNGITNEISDDMRHTEFVKSTKKLEFKQNISLEECFSRSGYPWGSKQELRILEPHAPKEVLSMKTLKVEGLKTSTSSEEIKQVFSVYGPSLADVYCPTSLNVVERNNEIHKAQHAGTRFCNSGFAYVRFSDRRDYLRALRDVTAGKVIIDGARITGESLTPNQWPTDRTRRYF